jgi:tetratricopeptide (TPR) repeat protein
MLQPGTVIGRYEIQRRLGRGGMGTVYVAHDPVLGRLVALKLFLSDVEMPDAAERFAREARAAAAFNHANIVTIHDFGELSSQPYIVMEYVQGDTLADVIRRKAPVSTIDKLRWIEELCSAVAYAHQYGVIHRDIKPTNLMIDRSGRLKVLDFGIAKMLGTISANATALIGTPGYMAPEQIVGGTIDHRSDLFSVGVVCYELLTYTEAFPGDNIPAITHRILSSDPTPLPQVLPDATAELTALVERALKKDPAERFEDAESMRAAIVAVRRVMELDPGSNLAAGGGRSWQPPSVSVKPGTGSARQQIRDVAGIAALTPPPPSDPRRFEARRAQQIAKALGLARECLEAGELEAALDACEEALSIDVAHPEALAVEESIRVAMAKTRAGELLVSAREELGRGSLTGALDLLQQARALDADSPDARRLERDLRLARVEQERLRHRSEALSKELAAAARALEIGDVEAALAHAREGLELDPQSADARTLEAAALRRLEEEAGTLSDYEPADTYARTRTPGVESTVVVPGAAGQPVIEKTIMAPRRIAEPAASPAVAAPAARKGPNRSPAVPAVRKDPFAPLRPYLLKAQVAWREAETRFTALPIKQKQMIGAGAVGVLVLAVLAIFLLQPAAAVPTGTLVIDAIPWAQIVDIQGEDGKFAAVPLPASTPMSLDLPAGTYRVRIAGPPPTSTQRTLTVQVHGNGIASAPIETFTVLTPEEYFLPYVTAPPVPPETTPPATAPPATAKPEGER